MVLNRNRVTASDERARSADAITAVIYMMAIALLVGTGGSAAATMARHYLWGGPTIDPTLLVALMLNLALILLGRLRHSAMRREVRIRTAAEERARLLASRDPLTGFLNRRCMAEEGSQMFLQARKRHKAMAVLALDLDHFKVVNDMYGHAVGDALLRAVASEIAAAMPIVALTARLGGDEFACAFLFDSSHPTPVEKIAERIVTRLAKPFDADGVHCQISCSVGIARSDADCPSMDTLMHEADIAMYAAKKGGKNRFAWFDRTMEQELNARNETESGLRTAIPNGHIIPYFEQQVDLDTGRVTGFEILARWQHPTRGIIAPDDFIPIAEETGMIADLSMSVLNQACRAALDWDPEIVLAINISPSQLRDPWLAQKIIKTLTETGFPASRLEVEITESALYDNLALAQSIVDSLKNYGIALALDDFGTGYSSLAHLRALPFDRIKIDKSFIMSLNDSVDSAAIVNAIFRLGESLNLPVMAEGVEGEAIAKRLRALGCRRAQGWLYGKPMSSTQARRFLAERGLLQSRSPVADSAPHALTPDSRRRAG